MDVLILALTIPLSVITSLAALVMIPLMLAATIEIVTAGRISFGIGNGRLWQRVRRGTSDLLQRAGDRGGRRP